MPQRFVDIVTLWWPTVVVFVIALVVVGAAHTLLRRRHEAKTESNLGVIGPLITVALLGIAVVSITLTLPIGDAARGQLLSLLGLLVTAAVALSSTTFLGNAMAGVMLRAIRHFRAGDYVRVGEHAGRVSDMGILHTEIQTEDRDLTTLPNLYLVTHPVTVLRSSGTVVSASVSLGYNLGRHEVEKHLLMAASKAGLVDPFVQVEALGDFSISYRTAGFLTEVRHLLTTRSNLRKAMLDCLHEAGIEIVSPVFENHRRLQKNEVFIPAKERVRQSLVEVTPETRIFDKADAAEERGKLQAELDKERSLVTQLEEAKAGAPLDTSSAEQVDALAAAKERLAALEEAMAKVEGELKEET